MLATVFRGNTLNCKRTKLIKDSDYMALYCSCILWGVSGAGAFCFCFDVKVVSAVGVASKFAESPSLGSVSLPFSISFKGISSSTALGLKG